MHDRFYYFVRRPCIPRIRLRVLEYKQIDFVGLNSMVIESCSGGPNHIVCGEVEKYVGYEQHRLNVVNQVIREDMIHMKVENRSYDHLVFMNRVTVTLM